MTARIGYFKPEEITVVSSGWLSFNDDYDSELAEYEGYIYRGDSGRFYTGTYHQDVGQESFFGPFLTLETAEEWMECNDFGDYSGGN